MLIWVALLLGLVVRNFGVRLVDLVLVVCCLGYFVGPGVGCFGLLLCLLWVFG